MQICWIYLGTPLFYVENFRENICVCLCLESKPAVLEKLRNNYWQHLAFRVGFGAVRAKFASFGPKKSKFFFISPRGCVVALQTDPSFNAEAYHLPPPGHHGSPRTIYFGPWKSPTRFSGPESTKFFFPGPYVKKNEKNRKNFKNIFLLPNHFGTTPEEP